MVAKKVRFTVHGLSLALGLALVAAYVLYADPQAVFRLVLQVPLAALAFGLAAFLAVWGLRVWTFHRLGSALPEGVSWATANRAFLGSGMLNLVFPVAAGEPTPTFLNSIKTQERWPEVALDNPITRFHEVAS